MQVKQVAELVGTSPDTVRRYAERFQVFMSPSATPPKGQARTFTPFDVNVLAYIVTLKQQALSDDEISARLTEHKNQGWANLPVVALPDDPGQTMPVAEAETRAYEMAQAAALRVELQHVRVELEQERERVRILEAKLETTSQDVGVKTEHVRALQVELAEAKGRIAALEGQLQAYSFGSRVISPLILIGVILVVAVTLVVILLVIGRLL